MAGPLRRVPDWLLERLAAGELGQRQAEELRARLHEQAEEGRLDELAASNRAILAALPPADVAREVGRRMRTAAPGRRARLVLVLAATFATGAAGLLLVASPLLHRRGHQVVEQPEEIGVKGDALQIHRRTKTGSQLVRDKDLARPGDTLQLGYQAGGKRYGVIASIDARGTVTLHLPESPGAAATLERNGVRGLAHSFELDDSPGFERFVFVRSDRPFTTADVVSALTSRRALPAGFDVFTMTLAKETP